MTEAPRALKERLAFARTEAQSPSKDWTGLCQQFVRMGAGAPPLFGSAWAQWLGADDEDKHVGGAPSDAPVGSAICYKGTGKYGHIVVAAVPFASGTPAAWSNDLVTYGEIDKVARTAATTHWGQAYLGYLTAINDYDLKFPVPKPKQDKRYQSIDKAITRLDRALEIAKAQKDLTDVEVLDSEIARLKRMYDRLRRA